MADVTWTVRAAWEPELPRPHFSNKTDQRVLPQRASDGPKKRRICGEGKTTFDQ